MARHADYRDKSLCTKPFSVHVCAVPKCPHHRLFAKLICPCKINHENILWMTQRSLNTCVLYYCNFVHSLCVLSFHFSCVHSNANCLHLEASHV